MHNVLYCTELTYNEPDKVIRRMVFNWNSNLLLNLAHQQIVTAGRVSTRETHNLFHEILSLGGVAFSPTHGSRIDSLAVWSIDGRW
jgi:hypothetical protein